MSIDSPALRIADLSFRYSRAGADWRVRVDHFQVAPGELVLLRGSSGCGKSTLLNLIAGVLDAESGKIEVDGDDITRMMPVVRDRLRGSKIGIIFQTFNLLHGFSAIENVMMAMKFGRVPTREHRKRAADLLAHLGITSVDSPPDRLSVGQQQRVAIARALACDPVIVLADEPTASLDPENARTAVELIRSACLDRGASLLCVSHDPSLGEGFDRVLTFADLSAAGAA